MKHKKMNNNQPLEPSIKIWFTKKEIMKLMSISVSTYKLRLKEFLSGGLYKHLTCMEFVQNSPFSARKRNSRLIHRDAVYRFFGLRRNVKGKKPSITQMLKIKWNLIGNFRLNSADIQEYETRIDFLIKRLANSSKKNFIQVAYSFEQDNSGIHCHFLIKHSKFKSSRKKITETLRLICQPTSFNLYEQEYNANLGDRGVMYSLKRGDVRAINYLTN
jgi:hypothetical protein